MVTTCCRSCSEIVSSRVSISSPTASARRCACSGPTSSRTSNATRSRSRCARSSRHSVAGSVSSALRCPGNERCATCWGDRRYLRPRADVARVRLENGMSDENRDQSLDPEDWTSLRTLAHRAVDDAFDHLVSVRDRPIWQVTPEPIVAKFQQPLPREPQGAETAYRDFREWVMPYPMGNTHPRFWSWYMGGGTAFGALGDFLAAMLNPNVGGGNHVANHVEAQVVDWCKDIVGLPREAGGLL